MPIHSISRQEFDAYKPARAPGIEMLVEEVEWFADERGVIIGALARDRTDHDWSYVVLGPDERGAFRGIEFRVNIDSLDAARESLLTKMREIESTGQLDFPQHDDFMPPAT